MLIAMRKLGHKKKNDNLGWIQSLLCQQEAWKKCSIIFHQFNGGKKKMITLNQTKQKQVNEADGHEALHI